MSFDQVAADSLDDEFSADVLAVISANDLVQGPTHERDEWRDRLGDPERLLERKPVSTLERVGSTGRERLVVPRLGAPVPALAQSIADRPLVGSPVLDVDREVMAQLVVLRVG